MTVEFLRFAFGGEQVRSVRRDDGRWFVGKDVCGAVLGIKDHCQALARLPAIERGDGYNVPTPSGSQPMVIISESGVRTLAYTSRMPRALELRRWIEEHILPHRGGRGPLTLLPQHRSVHRDFGSAALTDLEYQLLEMLHGRKRPAPSKWLSDNLRISDSALHGLVHRLRKKLLRVDYGIVNCRAEFGENGAYMLSDLTRTAKGRAA